MSTVILDAVSLSSNYLETVATKQAMIDAEIQDVAMTCFEKLVHFLFNYLFYPFYPAYEQFYHEKRVEIFEQTGKELPAYNACCFGEAVLFIHRFIASPSTIGSIFPSSTGLIESITRQISSEDEKPHRYLEIGAGTGPFTEVIVQKLKPADHLDVVEFDPALAKLLIRKFHHCPNVTIHPVSILDFNPSEKYDAVVSGLPLNAFDSSFVKEVLKKYVDLTKPSGDLSYFEYIGLGTLKKFFLCGEAYEDFCEILDSKQKFVEAFGSEIDEICCNITPARVLHCRIEKEAAQRYLASEVAVAAT